MESTKQQLTSKGGFIRPDDVLDKLEFHENMKVADFGCGSGYFTIPLAKRVGRKGTVYAIDVQDSALDSVRGRAKLFLIFNIETIRANLEKENGSTLPDRSIDIVILANILFQSNMKDAILKEAKRVMVKSGKLVVVEWKSEAQIGPGFGHRISKDDLKKLAKSLDLVLEKEFGAGESHYGLVFSL